MSIDVTKLQDFADAARPLLIKQHSHRHPKLEHSELATVCSSLQLGLSAARDRGAFANPWTIAGLGRREVRNCAVLARLWDHAITGVAGRRFLEATLRKADPDGAYGLPVDDIASRSYTVLCETCLAGDGTNRLDIVIESGGGERAWTIVIEAKIDAGFGDKQMERYLGEVRKREAFTRRKTFLLLLSPFVPADQSEIAHLRWRDVQKAARVAVGLQQSSVTDTEKLIAAFGDHISDFDH